MTEDLSGHSYKNLVASYIYQVWGDRGVEIYTELNVGSSIIGKARQMDIFLHDPRQNRAFGVECKWQDSQGTVDEKIPYALQDVSAMPLAGCIAYAGNGWSAGVLHLLQSSQQAAYCMPEQENGVFLRSTNDTRDLDHLLAIHFRWWDVLCGNKPPWSMTQLTMTQLDLLISQMGDQESFSTRARSLDSKIANYYKYIVARRRLADLQRAIHQILCPGSH